MRQVTRKGLITIAAAGGMFAAVSGGTAYADSGAQGAAQDSPGVLSGNNVQVPVNVPVNVCGNTVNVVGVLNPAFGNACADEGDSDSGAAGEADNSPGVGSGNTIQVPVDVPVNVCGNSIDVVGLLNPTFGNECGNDGTPGNPAPEGPGEPEERPSEPEPEPEAPEPEAPEPEPEAPESETPEPEPKTPEKQEEPPGNSAPQLSTSTPAKGGAPELAETGSGQELGVAGALGAGLMIGGYVLYRRSRAMGR